MSTGPTILVYGLLLLLALLLIARTVYPGKDQQGTAFKGANDYVDQPQTLKVATFNVQTGKSLEGVRDIQQSALALQDTHLAAVQEVYGAGWLNKIGLGHSQTQALAMPGGFDHLFAATRYRWFREQRGNTSLSRIPIKRWQVKMLPDQSRKSPRNMTISTFDWQANEVVFINTHLHTGRGRLKQLETVLAEFAKHPRAILAGDFNTRADEPLLADFLQSGQGHDAISAAGLKEEGEQRIDWILTRGFEVMGGRELPKGISDHPMFEVWLR